MVHPGFVRVTVAGRFVLHFDLADHAEIDCEALAVCRLYFKRSYRPEVIATLGDSGRRVLPFGLNFEVFPNAPDIFQVHRALLLNLLKDVPREVLRILDVGGRFSSLPRLRQFGVPPDYEKPPRALFLARTWDPRDDPGRPPNKVAEFERLNENRAACIRLLRRELGDRFLGGFSHTPHACRHYPDALAPSSQLTAKRNYLSLLKKYSVCVSTSGLHGSVGWKFSEYVSLSKAIVSEPLRTTLPGPLAAGLNYLAFEEPEDCVGQTLRLFEDDELRHSLMEANHLYYLAWGRPERIVWNAIQAAFSEFD